MQFQRERERELQNCIERMKESMVNGYPYLSLYDCIENNIISIKIGS